MIAVDTSVWVEFFRGRPPATERLIDLLDREEVALPVPVKIELLSGAQRGERARLGRLLAALPVLVPTDGSWAMIEKWITVGAARGHRFGFGDLLIAALAAEHGCAVWSLDSDFRRMANLGLVQLAVP